MGSFLKLLRIEQWYKNIVVFAPVIAAGELFNANLLLLSALAFFSLCFISSSYYIINDIKDAEKDRTHPEKSKRPIASGKISKITAVIISAVLFAAAAAISLYFLPSLASAGIFSLFLISLAYTFFVRDIAFMDIIAISFNFVLRISVGVFAISSSYSLSYWIILCAFFTSLYLVSVKRTAELSMENFKEYRPGFDISDKAVLEFIAILSASCLFAFFSVYSILQNNPLLLLSLPFALYITFMLFHDLHKNPINVRNPERFIFKKRILFSLLIWMIIAVLAIYLFR